MRRKSLVSLAFVSALSLMVVACGGDDDGGTIDAAPIAIDAAPVAIDSMPAQLTSGLGAQCQDPSECTAAATDQCIGATGAPGGNCSLQCGTSADNTTPPAGGDAMCAAAYEGSTGTPLCVYITNAAAPFTWSCGVLCGMAGTQDLGQCPAPLTCNLRTGQTFGDCN